MTAPVRRSHCGRVLEATCELVELVEFVADRDRTSLWRGVVRGAEGFARPVAVRKLASSSAARQAALRGATVDHANIVRVHDVSRDEDDNLYLVMDWVDGVGLDDFVRGIRLLGLRAPWPLLAGVGVAALHGLAAAHGHAAARRPLGADPAPAPLLHGHLSPRSILLDRHGGVRLTPIGLVDGDGGHAALSPYAAPEVRLGAPASVASELYAMGAILWEALTGAVPGPGSPRLERLRADVPPRLCEAIQRAVATAPRRRFVSADAMAVELASVLDHIVWLHGPQTDLGDAVVEVMAALAWHPHEPPTHTGDVVVHLSPAALTRPIGVEPIPDDAPYAAYEVRFG